MVLTEVFGSKVFNDKVMKERLPKQAYKALKETIEKDIPLQPDVADVVANAMKDWAIEKGATHYTHWFQPLTGITAEKHDSFISPSPDGSVIMEFSGKQLIQGEPDASSFPSGGLRATFEARGYTAWDCTSPAFLKTDEAGNVTLTIPTAFYSYNGEALDKKTPLLRSMAALSKQAVRVLKALGNTTSAKVTSTVGPEQEYFLVDKKFYSERIDLMLAGRTIFGAPAPKGQELEDQYFGAIKDRVSDYMQDLNKELWKIGITSKTQHNEVAPAQYEMAPIFATTNIATDHNQLVMETMQKVAFRHDLVCLLHEKPYAGINGSGKHNNWSLSSDDGINLLEPGKTPSENLQFLLFVSALLKAVDTHADILRATCATAGNDHRLGANEAPPAIVSIFMGEELTEILDRISKGEKITSKGIQFVNVGVDTLPMIPKDNTDRNRTSPFAFTGNKFEFRMVGSAQSIAGPNVALNTIAADVFDEIATRLEKARDKNAEAGTIIREIYKKHSRVIFNGNNYAEEWLKEAEKRGLPNVRNAVDALKAFITDKSLKLFEKHGVLSHKELHSRYDIYVEHYAKQINIEALIAIDMAKKQLLPAAIEYATFLADSVSSFKAVSVPSPVQQDILKKLSSLIASSYKGLEKLEAAVAKAQGIADTVKKAENYRDKVVTAMQALRTDIDALEMIVPRDMWPVPTYAELLFKL
ncbi:MAG: Glutamine synthetase [Syntrophorhabdus sp. PtaU1.Bin058]|nr:MAG: Glutamine synthetase [Syntrophorhabdus sp. PtaU1.Bin058]